MGTTRDWLYKVTLALKRKPNPIFNYYSKVQNHYSESKMSEQGSSAKVSAANSEYFWLLVQIFCHLSPIMLPLN